MAESSCKGREVNHITISYGSGSRGLKTESPMVNFISASALFNKLERNEPCLVVDIRTSAEYQRDRLECATIHMPLDQLDSVKLRELAASQPVYLLCRSDGRARFAARQLAVEGLDLVVIEGGLMACRALWNGQEPAPLRASNVST